MVFLVLRLTWSEAIVLFLGGAGGSLILAAMAVR